MYLLMLRGHLASLKQMPAKPSYEDPEDPPLGDAPKPVSRDRCLKKRVDSYGAQGLERSQPLREPPLRRVLGRLIVGDTAQQSLCSLTDSRAKRIKKVDEFFQRKHCDYPAILSSELLRWGPPWREPKRRVRGQ